MAGRAARVGLTAAVLLTSCSSTGPAEQTTVIHVIDGDTVIVDGRPDRVRLIGIDAPETAHEGRPAECGAAEATDRLRDLVQGRHVSLVSDRSAGEVDRYGRRLRYLEVGGVDAGEVLLHEGRAELFRSVPHVRQQRYRAAARPPIPTEGVNDDGCQPAA